MPAPGLVRGLNYRKQWILNADLTKLWASPKNTPEINGVKKNHKK